MYIPFLNSNELTLSSELNQENIYLVFFFIFVAIKFWIHFVYLCISSFLMQVDSLYKDKTASTV